MVVLTDSMYPEFQAGDLIFCHTKSASDVDVYKRQVQNALKGISEEAATLRVLGNYEAQTDK